MTPRSGTMRVANSGRRCDVYAFVARMTWAALRVPRGVCKSCRCLFGAVVVVVARPSSTTSLSLVHGSIFVTGVFVCRFKRASLISFSRMNVMSLYGHRLPAPVVSVAAGAPFTLCFRSCSSSVITVTCSPSFGASRFKSLTSSAAALARASVQKVRQPVNERHSHGTSCCSM